MKVANSRGPHRIEADVLSTGGRAVTAAEAAEDVDVVILSIPLNRLPRVAPLIAVMPADTVVIDTSNYSPARDSRIETIDAGQVRACGSPNSWAGRSPRRGTRSVPTRSRPRTGPQTARTASPSPLPPTATGDRRVGMALVEDTGFDAFDAGTLADSWRQQPGAPCYCTDLTREEMPGALAAAEAERLPKRRDLAVAAIQERVGDATTRACCESSAVRPKGGADGVWCVRSQGGGSALWMARPYLDDSDNAASARARRRRPGGTFATRPNPDADYGVRLNRALFM
ncbi:NAD(P)-binding domain-containing protein [Streptomyces niveus]